ncbi:MAG: glycosyltransferase family 4 protein [Candidatus Heimdallarchaeota archaeon]|nr:glycosyltransferase family 4 protein [Candidatus Heimdallarchaeota archaeon]
MSLNIAMIFELGPHDDGLIGGGVELHALNLSKALVKRGHKVTYITGSIPNNENKTNIEGVEIKRVDLLSIIKRGYNAQELKFSRQFFFLLKNTLPILRREIDSKAYDLFHGHVYSSGLVATALGKRNQKIIINTMHGSYYKYWSQLVKNRIKAGFYRGMERKLAPYLAKKAHCQIHTDYDYAQIVKNWCKEETKTKIHTVLNGVDIEKFHPEISPETSIIEEDGPIIMTTRRLVVKNGVIHLVRGFEKILKKHSSAKLLIVGDGPERSPIEREIKQRELSSSVKLTGMVPNDKIPSYLALADVVVVPSIVEASSISVLEAMAMRKAIVASDIPGIREITNQGKNCVLVPPKDPKALADGVIKLLDSKERAIKLAKLAYDNAVKDFSWEKKAQEIEALYLRELDRS